MGMNNNNLNRNLSESKAASQEDSGSGRKIVIGLVIGGIVILALLIVGVYFLLQDSETTAMIRDIFIIFMALVSLLLGGVLILLIIQLARLINLLQNEIKPILESTNETVNTLRGTTTFLSDNLVQPVMKLNEYMAAVSQVAAIIGLSKARRKNRE
jgi:hypothetical protein